MRILNFAPFDAHTNPMFIDLKIIKVRDMFDLQHLKLSHNCFFNNLPGDIMNLLSSIKEEVAAAPSHNVGGGAIAGTAPAGDDPSVPSARHRLECAAQGAEGDSAGRECS